jgi:hypothetical protein
MTRRRNSGRRPKHQAPSSGAAPRQKPRFPTWRQRRRVAAWILETKPTTAGPQGRKHRKFRQIAHIGAQRGGFFGAGQPVRVAASIRQKRGRHARPLTENLTIQSRTPEAALLLPNYMTRLSPSSSNDSRVQCQLIIMMVLPNQIKIPRNQNCQYNYLSNLLPTQNYQVLLVILFILGSGDYVKNPSIRGKVTKICLALFKSPQYHDRLQSYQPIINNVMPSCVRVFTAVEKAKGSYYDVRMQLKFILRVPIMDLFSLMLPYSHHKEVLRTFSQENSDEFLKFLNQMLNDATMQLDEGEGI